MAYKFENQNTANFKVQPQGKSAFMTLKGINSNETDAQTICNGVASLLACANITGAYENASRVVTEDVYNDDDN